MDCGLQPIEGERSAIVAEEILPGPVGNHEAAIILRCIAAAQCRHEKVGADPVVSDMTME